MKKNVCKVILLLVLFSFIPLSVFGATIIRNPLKYNTFQELISAILKFVRIVAFALAPIMIVVAGFYFVTSQGDPNKVTTAKQIVLWTAIGLAIIITSEFLITAIREVIEN